MWRYVDGGKLEDRASLTLARGEARTVELQLTADDAVRMALEALDEAPREGTVLIAYGDTPLLEGQTLRDFAESHREAGAAVSILSGIVASPYGYGRIVRDADGVVQAIVEEKDATDEQRRINEINSGILAFDAAFPPDMRRARSDMAQNRWSTWRTPHSTARATCWLRGGCGNSMAPSTDARPGCERPRYNVTPSTAPPPSRWAPPSSPATRPASPSTWRRRSL